jgi:hypothetical protein
VNAEDVFEHDLLLELASSKSYANARRGLFFQWFHGFAQPTAAAGSGGGGHSRVVERQALAAAADYRQSPPAGFAGLDGLTRGH